MPDILGAAGTGRRDRAVTAAPTAEPLLLCERVSKWYGPVLGVNQVTLELRGGITGLVGGNGAGKSTLLRLVTGHLRPDLGQVRLAGLDAWGSRAKALVGYCPDADTFYEEMSGRRFVEEMALLSGYPGAEARARAADALKRVGMEGRSERTIRGYSKGMRQRVKLAQALLHDPRLLVLDEPLSGIDPVGRAELVTLFRKLADEGKCLFISSHELDELEKLTDHVAIMARGRIAATGTVASIRERLADHPLTVRIDLRKGEPMPLVSPVSPADRFRQRAGGSAGGGDRDHRDLAALLLYSLPEVLGVELVEDEALSREGIGRLLVRARNTGRFFAELNKLVLEEWYDIVHLETQDESTQAVLGYLLGK